MKRTIWVNVFLYLLSLAMLSACGLETETPATSAGLPGEVTLQATPSRADATASRIPPEHATVTFELPQLEPTATPAVAPALPQLEPSPTPPSDLTTVDGFAEALLDMFREPDIDVRRRQLYPLLTRDFVMEIYPAGELTYIDNLQQAVGALSQTWLPADPQFVTGEVALRLPASVDPLALYNGEQPVEAIVHSTGWGLAGSGEALLYLTRDALRDALRWAGLVVSHDNFQPLPEMEIVVPPPGLVFRLGQTWQRVTANGERELLLQHDGPLSFSPSATRALYAQTNAQELTLFDFAQGISRTLPIDAQLMQGTWHTPWLDEDTAVLMVMEPGQEVTQGSIGNLALLEVTGGALQTLEPKLSVYARPSTTTGGAIVFDGVGDGTAAGNAIWREGEVMPLDLSDVRWSGGGVAIFHPVLSPDETKVAGVWGDESIFAPYTYGYIVVDLEERTAQTVHAILPVPTDAGLDWGMRWSPDGRWLALSPPSWDLVESGVWLVEVASGEKQFLGPLTSAPLWQDGEDGSQLLFNATVAGELQIHRFDTQTGERMRVNLPVGATLVQVATHAPLPPKAVYAPSRCTARTTGAATL